MAKTGDKLYHGYLALPCAVRVGLVVVEFRCFSLLYMKLCSSYAFQVVTG